MDLDPRKPFTIEAGRAAGLSRRQFGSADYPRVAHGLYVAAGVRTDALLRARPLLGRLTGDPHLSHQTAAELHGLWVPKSALLHVCRDAARKRLRPADIASHQCPCHGDGREPGDIQELAGVPVSSPLKCFRELADVLELVDLVILGDSLVRRSRCAPKDLVEAAAAGSGRGIRLARRAAGLVRAGVDSPMETRARMLRVLSGLPELETDLRFYDGQGQLVRRLDAGDRATLTAVEYDGRHHVQREEQWEADLLRRDEFEDQEWRIVTLVSKDIYTTPGRTVDRLARIFRRRGLTVGPRSHEWRRHFHGRET